MNSITLLAQQAGSTYYDIARVHSMPEGWHWLLLLLVCAAVLAYVIYMYMRDSVELSRGLAIGLVLLRVVGFVGILIWFLDVEKKTESKLVKHSRAVVLVDTSQSMGLRDSSSSSAPAGPSRIELIVDELSKGSLVEDLRAKHDVVFYGFDQTAKPVEVATLTKKSDETDGESAAAKASEEQQAAFATSRVLAAIAGVLLLISITAGLAHLFVGNLFRGFEGQSYAVLFGLVMLLGAVVVFAVANLRSPETSALALVGLAEPDFSAAASGQDSATGVDGEEGEQPEPELIPNWSDELLARGTETRLGDALRYVVNKERGGPIAGVVVFTDGRSNEGADAASAIAAAQEAQIPIYPVGMGSDKRPANARIVDLEAPRRVYPGDDFSLSGYVQSYGLGGRAAKLELYSSEDGADNSAEAFEEERRITLPKDGELMPVKFEVTPDETGKRVYTLRIVPPEQDHDVRDNEKTASVQIVERKNRVLLIAGGPMREYRFLRNLLYRDRDTTVDVFLQSAPPGISQEAHNVVYEFPSTAGELFEYDCIVGFDPDWTKFDEQEIELLDRWVAEKAGGLILIAGPVYTPQWAHRRRGDKRIDTVRALYPVMFDSRGISSFAASRMGGEAAWPLQFTREGLDSEFLWLEDEPTDSEAAWASFDGVYGFYTVKDPKPGARVFARFSDPSTSIDAELPVYMAGQFYGAGRVFFQASGEMWRLRAVDEAYFERYYTKLIRWASEGRLLRDSSRGVLLVDKDRALLGEQVTVRAILTDDQHNPLTDAEVTAVIVQPDAVRKPLVMRQVKDSAREGMYTAQFPVTQEGDYRLELQVAGDEELLTRDVRARVPAKEIEQPERNDPLLMEIAQKTNGAYYVGVAAAVNQGAGIPGLATTMEPQDQVTYLPGRPDKPFERLLLTWLLATICGAFCLEWLIRRLSKLA
ncbi:MAG: VWA domain-containing protein [Planctomycetales bacterium]|nr:VWA domain-containing protein [Planctomycetales bacterium]